MEIFWVNKDFNQRYNFTDPNNLERWLKNSPFLENVFEVEELLDSGIVNTYGIYLNGVVRKWRC